MRPRVFPAEDVRRWGVADSRVLASMRPRVFPAEDILHLRFGGGAFRLQ